MIKSDAIEVRNYLKRLIPYCEVAKMATKFKQEYSTEINFLWINQQQNILRNEIQEVIYQISSPRTRRIMLDKFVHGLTTDEIAKNLGVSTTLCYESISAAYREITLPTVAA